MPDLDKFRQETSKLLEGRSSNYPDTVPYKAPGSVFQAGDTVRLKSGGSVMTVLGTKVLSGTGPYICYCAWFDGGRTVRDDFPEAALEKCPAGV